MDILNNLFNSLWSYQKYELASNAVTTAGQALSGLTERSGLMLVLGFGLGVAFKIWMDKQKVNTDTTENDIKEVKNNEE